MSRVVFVPRMRIKASWSFCWSREPNSLGWFCNLVESFHILFHGRTCSKVTSSNMFQLFLSMSPWRNKRVQQHEPGSFEASLAYQLAELTNYLNETFLNHCLCTESIRIVTLNPAHVPPVAAKQLRYDGNRRLNASTSKDHEAMSLWTVGC